MEKTRRWRPLAKLELMMQSKVAGGRLSLVLLVGLEFRQISEILFVIVPYHCVVLSIVIVTEV